MDTQDKIFCIALLVVGVVGFIFFLVRLTRCDGKDVGMTPAGLVAFFVITAIATVYLLAPRLF